MKREIKFRVFVDNEMIYLPFAGLGYFDFEGSYALSFAVDGYSEFWAHEHYDTITKERCKDAPIMQYTGLKDKNGKEVYEGDIIAWRGNGTTDNNKLCIVEYRGGCFVIIGINGHRANWWLDEYNQAYEVIGNIYQNPELSK